MDGCAFARSSSCALGRFKQSRIEFKAWNALRLWHHRQAEAFAIDKNARRINRRVRPELLFTEQAIEQRQRLRRDKFAADFLAREKVFFQQKHTDATVRRSNGAR